ncbi:MAG: CRISPR-associated endonuclease Cas1 [Methanocellales archaeon]|nr:CRISPR-associated endonuclease Cas1 [Methanocellales archaeon]
MDRLVVNGYGKYVGTRENQIVVKEKGKIIAYELAEKLRQVLITGRGSISFDAMNLLAENGVDLLVVDWKGEVKARLSSPSMRTVKTRREQYYAYNDKRGVRISKNIALAKLRNQYAVLGTLAKRRKETKPESAETLTQMRNEISAQIPVLEQIKSRTIDNARETIMGVEGICSSYYWRGFASVIPEDFSFNDRSGRYARDPVNAMLNYGYGILRGEVWRAVHFAGLDPYGGFLHVDRPGRPSMVLDLMEEFRQHLVDKSVVRLITKRMVSPNDFALEQGLCKLSDSARKKLLSEILGKFEDYVRVGSNKMRWCDLIVKQARDVAKYLRGETTSYEGFYQRW